MCNRGTMTLIALKTGELVEVDSCLAPLVAALNDGGIPTRGCCCGHGVHNGHVELVDGRLLIVRRTDEPTT
jgi:hypothetical protein